MPGQDGMKGEIGPKGEQGFKGARGPRGEEGPLGPKVFTSFPVIQSIRDEVFFVSLTTAVNIYKRDSS